MAVSKADFPVVGDYVLFRMTEPYKGIIERIDNRKNSLDRLSTTSQFDRQILASNIDLIFICMAMNQDFNLTKLNNFIMIANQKMIEYRIILTKKDLCEDRDFYLNQVKRVSDATIDCVSIFEQESIALLETIIGNSSCVFVGSSGVGKSSLINQIIGTQHFKTNDIRLSDAQGRHTTTHRELIMTKNGGAIIDTPGIRIIQFFESDHLDEQFDDIVQFAADCHFRDCTHKAEPGCNVVAAIEAGLLDEERLKQYYKLLKINDFHKRQKEIQQLKYEKRRNRK